MKLRHAITGLSIIALIAVCSSTMAQYGRGSAVARPRRTLNTDPIRQALLQSSGFNDLREAMANNDVVRLRRALKEFPNAPLQADDFGRTALHYAVATGDETIVQAVVVYGKGFGIKAQDRNNETPLHYAVRYGFSAIAKQLIQRGADPMVKNKSGDSPASMAFKPANCDMLLTFLDAGVSPLSLRLAPLHVAVLRADFAAVKKCYADGTIEVDINSQRGVTPLMMAADRGNVPIINELLAHNANVNAKDDDGTAPVVYAVYANKPEALKALVAGGADLQMKDSQGYSLMAGAAQTGNLSYVQLLLDAGAKPGDLVATGPTPLHISAGRGDIQIMSALIAAGADPNAKAADGTTPLCSAARNGKTSVALLLSKGANPNVDLGAGRTPEHVVASFAKPDVLEAMKLSGGRIDAAAEDGRTPLFDAIDAGNQAVIEMLLTSGANPSTVDKNGWTPLHLAALKRNVLAVKTLVARGAALNSDSLDGSTPYDVALFNDAGSDTCTYFKSIGALCPVWEAASRSQKARQAELNLIYAKEQARADAVRQIEQARADSVRQMEEARAAAINSMQVTAAINARLAADARAKRIREFIDSVGG